MFLRRRRAAALERQERLDAARRLLEQYGRLRARIVAVEEDGRKRALVVEILSGRLRQAEAELRAERDRREAAERALREQATALEHERVARSAVELELAAARAEPPRSLADELAPLWSHLAGQRELLHGLAQRVEHAVRRLQQPLEAVPEKPAPEPAARETTDGYLLLLSLPSGYDLVECRGPVPTSGVRIEVGGGGPFEVLKVARSPLPRDVRRCVYALPLSGAVVSAERRVQGGGLN